MKQNPYLNVSQHYSNEPKLKKACMRRGCKSKYEEKIFNTIIWPIFFTFLFYIFYIYSLFSSIQVRRFSNSNIAKSKFDPTRNQILYVESEFNPTMLSKI